MRVVLRVVASVVRVLIGGSMPGMSLLRAPWQVARVADWGWRDWWFPVTVLTCCPAAALSVWLVMGRTTAGFAGMVITGTVLGVAGCRRDLRRYMATWGAPDAPPVTQPVARPAVTPAPASAPPRAVRPSPVTVTVTVIDTAPPRPRRAITA